MKYLKVCPAYGHNIEQFFRCFNKRKDVMLTVLYTGDDKLSYKYKNIYFVRLISISGLIELLKILASHYNAVWLHSGNRLLPLFALLRLLTFSNKTYWILNVWGEKIIKKIEGDSFKSRAYRFFFERFDLIQFNWFTLERKFKDVNLGVKSKTLLWGMPKCFFDDNVGDYVKDKILEATSEDKYKFFYPKSFTSQSAHLLLAKAIKNLSSQNKDFIVFILEGNGRVQSYFDEFNDYVNSNNLSCFVKFLKFDDYLNPSEMKYLWSRMHCGLQIVYGDQLSNTFIEPQATKKPVIASNIKQYQDFRKEFAVKLSLVENDVFSISDSMLQNIRVEDDVEDLNERYDAILKIYIFEDNFNKMICYHSKSIGKQSV